MSVFNDFGKGYKFGSLTEKSRSVSSSREVQPFSFDKASTVIFLHELHLRIFKVAGNLSKCFSEIGILYNSNCSMAESANPKITSSSKLLQFQHLKNFNDFGALKYSPVIWAQSVIRNSSSFEPESFRASSEREEQL